VRTAYLLHGDETFLVERALALLRDRLGEDPAEPIRTLWADADAPALASALDDLASPSLFGGAQALVVRRADALAARDEALVLAELPRLRPPACLVLVARALDARRRLLAAFDRGGGAYAFPRVTDGRVLQDWVVRLARELGHEIRQAAAALLVDRSMLDLAGLASEVEKASLYAGRGVAIDTEHVEATAVAGRTAAVDELSDRLARGDRAGAHRALRALLRAGEPPIRIVAFLAGNLRRTLHVAELAEQGMSQDAIASRLGMPAWLVRRIRDARPAAQLEQALDTLRTLDLELKSSRPPAAAFEAALAAVAGAPGATGLRRP
jgi:DNA polymerase III subunit delta